MWIYLEFGPFVFSERTLCGLRTGLRMVQCACGLSEATISLIRVGVLVGVDVVCLWAAECDTLRITTATKVQVTMQGKRTVCVRPWESAVTLMTFSSRDVQDECIITRELVGKRRATKHYPPLTWPCRAKNNGTFRCTSETLWWANVTRTVTAWVGVK